MVPGVDLALIREWEQVKTEMIVGRNKRVETPLHFIKIVDLDPLVDVKPRNPLDESPQE